jgi:hypothetical protein
MADGQSVPFFAETTFDSLQSATFPPIAFFGLSCSEGGHKRKERTEEYLGPKGQDLFDHHHDVFISVMPKLATRMLRFNRCRSKTVVAGFSNGGAFAYRMAFEHPWLFGNVVLMSPQRIRKEVDFSRLAGYETKFFLAAGELGLERLFKKNALRIKQDLDGQGFANTLFHDPDGDHSFFLWDEAFPKAMSWFFSGASVDICPLGQVKSRLLFLEYETMITLHVVSSLDGFIAKNDNVDASMKAAISALWNR